MREKDITHTFALWDVKKKVLLLLSSDVYCLGEV